MTPAPDDLTVAPNADADEAAAIAAALEVLLGVEAAAGDGRTAGRGWDGRRFAFAGRLEKLGREPARVPVGAPVDPWSAAARVDRF